LITVISGGKGLKSEVEEQLKKYSSNSPDQIIADGLSLVNQCLEVFSHLTGDSNQSQSLSLVPALYFYTENGRYVRSLLYGFIYWMFSDKDEKNLLEPV